MTTKKKGFFKVKNNESIGLEVTLLLVNEISYNETIEYPVTILEGRIFGKKEDPTNRLLKKSLLCLY